MSKLKRLLLFAYIAFVGAGFLFWAQLLIESQIKRFPLCIDFIRYYAFGALALSPDHSRLYDIATQSRWIEKVVEPARLPHSNFIEYPPQLALFIAPFVQLPVLTAYFVFTLVGIVLCGVAFCWLRGGSKRISAIVFLLFCASTASFFSNWFGQISFFYTAVLAIFVRALRKENVLLTGASLAVLSLKFQFVPFLFVAAVSKLNRKSLAYTGAFILSLLVLFAASAALIEWNAIASYPQAFINAEFLKAGAAGGTRGLGFESMIGLSTAVCNVLNIHGRGQQVISLICAAGGLLGVAIVLLRARTPASINRALAITISAALIFSPHSHTYDELMLLIPVALMCDDETLPDEGREMFTPLTAIIVAYPVITWLIFAALYMPFRDTIFPLANTLLNIAVLAAIVSLRRNAAQTEPQG